MMLFAAGLGFILVWSALVWGSATSGSRSNNDYAHWPAFWRTHILLACLPVMFIFGYAFLPDGLKPDFTYGEPAMVVEGLPVATLFGSDTQLQQFDLLRLIEPIVWGIGFLYITGFCVYLLKFAHGKVRVHNILANAAYLEGQNIWVTTENTSPFAHYGAITKIIFPDHLLQALSDEQIRLIIRHEEAHLSHRDPVWADFFSVLQIVFWFSPFLRDLINRWHTSAELRSDRIALTGAAPECRKAYAQSLITALRLASSNSVRPSAAFTDNNLRSEQMRIKNIMDNGGQSSRGFAAKLQLLAASTALALVGCASAAAVSDATVEQGEVAKDVKIEKKVRIVKERDGKMVELSYDDLTEEEKKEIDKELVRAEQEVARAMAELDRAKIEIELHEEEIEHAREEIKRVLIMKDVDVEAEIAMAQKELEAAKGEIEKARVEITIAKKEMVEARKEFEAEREFIEQEKN